MVHHFHLQRRWTASSIGTYTFSYRSRTSLHPTLSIDMNQLNYCTHQIPYFLARYSNVCELLTMWVSSFDSRTCLTRQKTASWRHTFHVLCTVAGQSVRVILNEALLTHLHSPVWPMILTAVRSLYTSELRSFRPTCYLVPGLWERRLSSIKHKHCFSSVRALLISQYILHSDTYT